MALRCIVWSMYGREFSFVPCYENDSIIDNAPLKRHGLQIRNLDFVKLAKKQILAPRVGFEPTIRGAEQV